MIYTDLHNTNVAGKSTLLHSLHYIQEKPLLWRKAFELSKCELRVVHMRGTCVLKCADFCLRKYTKMREHFSFFKMHVLSSHN